MYTYNATIVRVVDGDTLIIDVDVGFCITIRQRFRLKDINAYEIKDPNGKGIEARKRVEQLISEKGPVVLLKTYKEEKFGRYLAEVILESGAGANLGQLLLHEGLAVIYE